MNTYPRVPNAEARGSSRARRIGIAVTIVAAFFAVLVGGTAYFMRRAMDDGHYGGDFTLQSNHGPVSLRQFRGKPVILYFGYTSCPDACPFAMSRLSKVLKTFPEAQRQQFVPVFVSVDTRSDTPEKVAKYVSFFFPEAYGLTGTPRQLDEITRNYGTSYTIEDEKGSALGYTVQHGTNFYLINRAGILANEMPTEEPESALKSALAALL